MPDKICTRFSVICFIVVMLWVSSWFIWFITHFHRVAPHVIAWQWRQNGRDSVSNHQPHDCLLNRLFRRRSKKTSKLRVTDLCADRWIPRTNGLLRGKCFHLMTSSYSVCRVPVTLSHRVWENRWVPIHTSCGEGVHFIGHIHYIYV